MKPIKTKDLKIFDNNGKRIQEERLLPIEFSGTVFARVKSEETKQERPRILREKNLDILDDPNCVTTIGNKAMTTSWFVAKALGAKHEHVLLKIYLLKDLDIDKHIVPTGSIKPKTFWLDKTGVALIMSHFEHSDDVALKLYKLLDAAEDTISEQRVQKVQANTFQRLLEVGKALSDFSDASKNITLTVEQIKDLLKV